MENVNYIRAVIQELENDQYSSHREALEQQYFNLQLQIQEQMANIRSIRENFALPLVLRNVLLANYNFQVEQLLRKIRDVREEIDHLCVFAKETEILGQIEVSDSDTSLIQEDEQHVERDEPTPSSTAAEHRLLSIDEPEEFYTADEQQVILLSFDEPVEFNTGLSEDEIKNLQIIYTTKEHVEDQCICSICCTSYEEGEEVNKLPCDHLYHKECITSWITSNGTCPNCRKNVSTGNDDM